MYHPIDIYVGQRVRFKRKILGLTQSDLAEKVDLTFQQIQKYEKGENRVSASKLYQIAKILNTSVSFFFEGYSDSQENNKTEYQDQPVIDDRQALTLVQAFSTIKDPKVQKRIMMLINSVSDTES